MTHGQTQYQIRFDWGLEGASDIGVGADVIVVVDVLSFCTAVDLGLSAGLQVVPLAAEGGKPTGGAAVAAALSSSSALVVAGSLRNRRAIADWALAQQGDKGDRFTVAVIAAGEPGEKGGIRFCVEDLLGAGAVIDALADVGIDYCSPEAATASAAFTGLSNATGHLIGASAGGRELAAHGRRPDVDVAIDLDVSSLVPILGEFGFHL